MKNGIDCISAYKSLFAGKSVGLLTNQSGLDGTFRSTVDILNERFRLVRLFAAEHGIRGELQDGVPVDGFTDPETGLQVCPCDLPGAGPELEGVDLFVYDIQDVGLRMYTYIYAMADCMRACAARNIPFVVLDRPCPLGLSRLEGNVLPPSFSNNIAKFGLPVRYGLTVGELAGYVNAVYGIGAALTVVPCEGLTRQMTFRSFSGPWVPTSPNLPTYDSLLMYTGTVLLEGTNLSEGRGTTRPFETFGAPWLRADRLSKELSQIGFPGLVWRETYFKPAFGKYAGAVCRGLQCYVTDESAFEGFRFALYLLKTAERLHPAEFAFNPWLEALMGGNDIEGLSPESIEPYLSEQKEKQTAFLERVSPYLIYRP